jgi:hypothetical protein
MANACKKFPEPQIKAHSKKLEVIFIDIDIDNLFPKIRTRLRYVNGSRFFNTIQ